jgi:hypothetical protein
MTKIIESKPKYRKIDPLDYFIDDKGHLNILQQRYELDLHCSVCDKPTIHIDGFYEVDSDHIKADPNILIFCKDCRMKYIKIKD